MTTYELDPALKGLEDRVRRLELAVARNKPASGIDYNDDGGFFGGGTLTIADIISYFGLGTAPDSFLRSKGGEVHYIDPHGVLGASSIWDLANGNAHTGELDQDCDITPIGWPAGKRGYLAWSITGDGTSTPTFLGVTWTDAAPGVIGSGDVLHGLLWSDDTGTTIWGSVAGGGGSGSFPGDVMAHGAMGATETLDYTDGTAHTGTLDDDCTVDFAGFTAGKDDGITFLVSEDGTGGHTLTFTGVTWLGGVTPTHDDTAGSSELYGFICLDGSTVIAGKLGAGATSVTAATISALGFVGPILMTDGITSPPEPLWTDDGTDYLYQDMG